MRSLILIAVTSSTLLGCAGDPFHRSAYPSGWSQATTLAAQKRCGVVRWDKGILAQPNLDLLVTHGYLTPEQASRAAQQDVRPGDPECLAWAAFGLQQTKVTMQTDGHGKLFTLTIDYRCVRSDVACPGRRVDVVDGVVTSVSPLAADGP